jgi:hypothetical protein
MIPWEMTRRFWCPFTGIGRHPTLAPNTYGRDLVVKRVYRLVIGGVVKNFLADSRKDCKVHSFWLRSYKLSFLWAVSVSDDNIACTGYRTAGVIPPPRGSTSTLLHNQPTYVYADL